jgi:hypothetical protein
MAYSKQTPLEYGYDDERCEKYKLRLKYAACPELREAKARDRAAQKAAKLQKVAWQDLKDEQCRGLAQGRHYHHVAARCYERPFASDRWMQITVGGEKRWIYDHWMVEFTINELRNLLHRPIHAEGHNYTTYTFPPRAPTMIVDCVMGKHVDLTDPTDNPLLMCRRAPSVYSRRYWEQDSPDAQLARGLELGKKLWTSFACSGVRGIHYRFEPADHQTEFWRKLYMDWNPRKYVITESRCRRCPHVFPAVCPQPLVVNELPEMVNPETDFSPDGEESSPPPPECQPRS